MRIIYWITYFIVIVDLIYVVRTIVAIYMRKKYLHDVNRNIEIRKKMKFLILLPALREQAILNETIEHFKKLICPNKNVDIYVITTEREEYEYKLQGRKKVTTGMLAEKKIVEVNRELGYELYKHVHSQHVKGNKSTQLNVAVEEYINKLNINSNNIEEKWEEIKNTYVCVFDFDARPQLETLVISEKIANMKNYPDVMQQIPCSFKNFYETSGNIKNTFIILQGIYQTVRCYGIEMFRTIMSSIGVRKLFPMYCMGAGMQIRLDSLLVNDMFPFFVDDITLGYRISINNGRFAYIPNDCFVELPSKTNMLFNQGVLIYKGVLTSFSEVKRNFQKRKLYKEMEKQNTSTDKNEKTDIEQKIEQEKRHMYSKANICEIMKMMYEGIMSIIPKTLEPYLIIFVVVDMVIKKQISIFTYLMICMPYLWFIAGYLAAKSNKVKAKKWYVVFLAFLVSPIYFVFNTFGGLIYYKRLIISNLKNEEVKYKKTER